MTKLTNSSLGPLRRRKQKIAEENAIRATAREEREYRFQLSMYSLFVFIHRLGQEVPRDAWEKSIRASHGTASVDEVLEQVAKYDRVPEEYVCGFPENMYEWVMANQERAINLARDLASTEQHQWWDDRNWLISHWFIRESFDDSDRSRFYRTAYNDYIFDLFYNDPELVPNAIKGLRAFQEKQESPKCSEVVVEKDAVSLMDVNNRENKRFWKKSFRMIVFIVIAYAALASIILWKVATS